MVAVLVTGASSGFGRLTAETLVARGHKVVAGMRQTANRNREAAESLRRMADEHGGRLHVVDMDVTEASSVSAAVATAVDVTGGLDVLVNNAGFLTMGLTECHTEEQLRAVLETNVVGAHRVARAVLPGMRAAGAGLLITMSVALEQITLPFLGTYVASKRALEALAETYRYELAPLGIDSVILEAGGYPTPIFDKGMAPDDVDRAKQYGDVAEMPNQMFHGFLAELHGPDGPRPQEVAAAIVTLIEMRPGERPLRTILDRFTGDITIELNEQRDRAQQEIMTRFGLGQLLGVRPISLSPDPDAVEARRGGAREVGDDVNTNAPR